MNVCIINGAPNDQFKDLENGLKASLSKDETLHIDTFYPRNMDIHYCCGCFGCWVKTPGSCIFKDDMGSILKSLASADIILYSSPLIAGFISSETKKVMDRFIPTALPFIKVYGGECHHPNRYKKPTTIGVLILEDGPVDSEAFEIVSDTFDRFGLNAHASRVIHQILNAEKLEEICHEISHN